MSRQAELTSQLDLLSRKIAELRKAFVIEAGAAIRFQLQEQIAQAEKERTVLDTEIELVKKQIASKLWINQPQPLPKDAPLPGGSVIFTCDRSKQDERFQHFFSQLSRERQGTPQAYFILGEWEQRPGSLVVRFKDTWIREHVTKHFDAEKTRIVLRRLEWPDQDDLEARRKRLAFRLLRALNDNSGADTSTAACRQLLIDRYADAVVVIEHNVLKDNWDRHTRKLLNWYLNYWDEVRGNVDIPLCMIFFNIIYPASQPSDSLLRRARNRFKRLRKTLFVFRLQGWFHQPGRVIKPRQASVSCSSVILQELECVKLDDVLGWFQRINLGDAGRLQQWCSDIFGTSDPNHAPCQSMLHVETKLNELREEIEAMYFSTKGTN